MCGRFNNHVAAMHDWLPLLQDWPQDLSASYNVAPGQLIPVFNRSGGHAMHWGLIPGWSKAPDMRFSTFNARTESLAEKPAFRDAWQHGCRCLIPAAGYYEWRQEGANKQPYYIHSEDGTPLLMAAIWEPAHHDQPASCSILTQAAQGITRELHPRQPVLVPRKDHQNWLSEAAPSSAEQLINSWVEPALAFHAVSIEVNKVTTDNETLIQENEINLRLF